MNITKRKNKIDDQAICKKEIVARIRAAVELVKKSGSKDVAIACTSRAAAIVRLSALARQLAD